MTQRSDTVGGMAEIGDRVEAAMDFDPERTTWVLREDGLWWCECPGDGKHFCGERSALELLVDPVPVAPQQQRSTM